MNPGVSNLPPPSTPDCDSTQLGFCDGEGGALMCCDRFAVVELVPLSP